MGHVMNFTARLLRLTFWLNTSLILMHAFMKVPFLSCLDLFYDSQNTFFDKNSFIAGYFFSWAALYNDQ